MLVFASAALVFSVLHHADHVIRGSHSGWPFGAEVTPFTYSLLIYALILPAIYLTARGATWPATTCSSPSGVGPHRFRPLRAGGGHEAPIGDIYAAYGSTSAGLLALGILAGLITSVAALAVAALGTVRTRYRSTKGG